MRIISIFFALTVATWSALAISPGMLAMDAEKVPNLVGSWRADQSGNRTLNGAGISELKDRTWTAGRLENLLVQSEDFSTTWSRDRLNAFGATDTGAAGAGSFANTSRTTDPLGANTADFIQEDATASNDHRFLQSVIAPSGTLPAGSYSVSVYVKAAGRTWVSIRVGQIGTLSFGYFFDVQNGVVGNQVTDGSPTGVSASISSAGNGWFLCVVNGTLATPVTGTMRVTLATGNGTTVYSGDNTSGLFVWGAQLRRSTSSATYVRTTTVVEDALRSLLQGTAANQPLISRTDNKGNLLVRSEEFQTTWTRTRINAFGATDTGAAGAGSFANTSRTTDPLGGNTADFGQEDSTASNSHDFRQTLVIPAGTFAFSIYAKPAGRSWLQLEFGDIAAANFCAGYFDVQNGVVGTVSNGGTGSGAALSVTSAGNGWYLCTLTGVQSATLTTGRVVIRFATADGGNIYSGDNTSGLYLWGASLRLTSWDSDYIATTATPAIPGLNGMATAYFDGSAYYLKTGGMASLVQPETVVMVVKQWTWTSGRFFLDGNANSGMAYAQVISAPQTRNSAGTPDAALLLSPALGNWYLISAVWNGASSLHQLGNAAAATGGVGSGNAGGLTMGARGDNSNFGNIQVARVLLYNRALSTDELAYLRSGLSKQWNFGL